MKLPPSNQHSHVPLACFKIAKIGKQPKDHSSDEWMGYVVQTLGGVLVSLNKADPALCVKCTNLENLVLFETIWRTKNRLSALTCAGNIVTMNKFLCNIHRENEAVLTKGRRKWGGVGERMQCARRAGWRSLKTDWIVVHRQHYTLRTF